jgi:hypothetical protein
MTMVSDGHWVPLLPVVLDFPVRVMVVPLVCGLLNVSPLQTTSLVSSQSQLAAAATGNITVNGINITIRKLARSEAGFQRKERRCDIYLCLYHKTTYFWAKHERNTQPEYLLFACMIT